MSLLSSFLGRYLIPALEQAYIEHEPEIKKALALEVKGLARQAIDWAELKLGQDLNSDGKIGG